MKDAEYLYVSDENIKHMHEVFVHSPHKLTQAATYELQMLQNLFLCVYKL